MDSEKRIKRLKAKNMNVNRSSKDDFKEKIDEVWADRPRSIRKADFDIFHFSVSQKLWEANYYDSQIDNFRGDNYYYPSSPGPQSQSVTVISGLDKNEIARFCNMFIDGYFMSVMSIFDSLAHEINVVFRLFSYKEKKKIYFYTIEKELKKRHSSSEFYKCISRIIKKRWWKDLEKYRNAISHEAIVAKNIDTSFDVTTGRESLKRIPMPDNPKNRPFSYKKGFEMKTYIEKFHRNISPALDQCYKKLLTDLLKENRLPINL